MAKQFFKSLNACPDERLSFSYKITKGLNARQQRIQDYFFRTMAIAFDLPFDKSLSKKKTPNARINSFESMVKV